jgi:septal ring factor EnvC (AmiA/AmiB activator)
MTMQDDIQEIKEDTRAIKADIDAIKEDVAEHIARTAALEARQGMFEQFLGKLVDSQQKNFESIVMANEKNQSAMNRQLKISLGVFAALSALVSGLAAWLS